MNSIKRTLLGNYFAIIAVMAMVTGLFILVYSASLKEQQRFAALIQLEYGLNARADDLVRIYNEYRNGPSEELREKYMVAHELHNSDVATIRRLSFSGSGRTALDGVDNTFKRLTDTIDVGITAIQASDVAAATTAYDEANKLLLFMPDGISRLLFEELETTKPILAVLAQRQTFALGAGVLLLLVVTLSAVGTAVSLARKISKPMEQLAHASRSIAEGNLDAVIDASIKQSRNEIADLATAFDTMMANLRKTVGDLKKANSEMLQARNDMQDKNSQLEQLNLLFITRERRISELKDQLRAAGQNISDSTADEIDYSGKGV